MDPTLPFDIERQYTISVISSHPNISIMKDHMAVKMVRLIGTDSYMKPQYLHYHHLPNAQLWTGGISHA